MSKINLKDFFSDKANVKYLATRKGILLSKEKPEELYHNFDFFLQFLFQANFSKIEK